MDYNKEIFKGKTIAKLMEEAYKDKNDKSSQLRSMINQLKDLINDGGDAVMMVPLIKEYMDVAVKNDDHLIKLAAIIQRYISTKQTIEGADSFMSDEEKKQLLAIAEETYEHELSDEIKKIQQEEQDLNTKIVAAKDKLNDNRS